MTEVTDGHDDLIVIPYLIENLKTLIKIILGRNVQSSRSNGRHRS